jgi:hypothetical protein
MYSAWTAAECRRRDCLEIHAKAGLEVDLSAVGSLLARKLPRVLACEPVEALRDTWPAPE